jgi:tRNA(fMet)-specific endonuclease VapC
LAPREEKDVVIDDRKKSVQGLRLKVRKMDLRIAATTLARNATVVTRNLRDFRQVPGLRIEAWSK